MISMISGLQDDRNSKAPLLEYSCHLLSGVDQFSIDAIDFNTVACPHGVDPAERLIIIIFFSSFFSIDFE